LTGKIIKDKVEVLEINPKPDTTSPLTRSYDFEVVKEYRDAEGYIDTKKIEIGFFDVDDDGVVDNPEGFVDIVAETVNPAEKYIFVKKYITTDQVEDFKFVDATEEGINIVASTSAIGAYSQYNAGQLFFDRSTSLFYKLDNAKKNLNIIEDYRGYIGRDKLKFRYLHSADYNQRIDPAASNIIDTYLLTRSYDTFYRQWLAGDIAQKPIPASADQLFQSYGTELDKIKSISDEVIYHPVKYKPLFGSKAETSLQATFKIVKNPDTVVNDNEIKSRVISAINTFFNLDNWEFGESFYFTELSTFIMNELTPDVVSIVIVPNASDQSFGSLFEIKSEADEIFVNSATVNNVEIIDAVTAGRLKATGNVVTASQETANTGVQSSSSGSVISSGSTGGGLDTNSNSGGGYGY